MSTNILNLISDIKAGKPVGIVRHVPPNPRDFLMYGRKDGVTIGQHLAEFDTYKDEHGRSFDEIMMDGLLSDNKELMPPPPNPTSMAGKSTANKVNVHDYFSRLDNYHLTQSTARLVQNPEHKKAIEEQALKGARKRKLGQESSDMQAKNAQVLKDSEDGRAPKTQRLNVDNNDGVRKRPMQKRPNF